MNENKINDMIHGTPEQNGDVGIPKKNNDEIKRNDDDQMDQIVNLDEFTQMGDEEDHESV